MIAVIYTFHEYNPNVEFFIKYGLFDSEKIHFYIVINSTDITINLNQYRNIKTYNRNNFGHDFGAWSYCLFQKTLGQESLVKDSYDYYIFINSSVKGPFLPVWYNEKDWTKLFVKHINNDLKLFGTSIGNYDNNVHVQSMLLVTDKIGLKIGIDNNIFDKEPKSMDRWDVIVQKELGFSKFILSNGYNIGCLLASFQDVDFRVQKIFINNLNVFGHDDYYGIEVHPYEVIFIKVPKFGHEYLFKTIDRYSSWNKLHIQDKTENKMQNKKTVEIKFDWRDYLKNNRDVFWIDNSEDFANYHYNNFGIKENRKINNGELKYWELYGALNSDILPTHPRKREIITHYNIHGKLEGRKTEIDNFDIDKFHWIHYKFINNIPQIVTKIQSLYHYEIIGKYRNLEYYPVTQKKAFLIDLNPLSTSGLFNQIISLLNGILLAWCCNRDLYVSGFYPDYNQQKKISLKKVINITHLNNMLKMEGINVVINEDYKDKSWKKSILYDPTKVDFNDPKYINFRGSADSEPLGEKKLILIMKHIFNEQEEFIDIGDVFDYFIFRENIDESLRLLFRSLVINIKYDKRLYDICDYCISKQGMTNFSSIHLRLEDDILFHRPDKSISEHLYGENIKDRYLKIISKKITKNETIYLSTFLLKSPNKYNYFPMILRNSYPNLRYWKKPEFYWRNDFKDLIEGREIDALIDYLLCLKSSKFIGFDGSTFSEMIKYYFEFYNKNVDLI